MLNSNILQADYSIFSSCYQLKLPLELEIMIPSDDKVRLLSTFVEEMELSDLYRTYSRLRKNQASPRQLLKIVVYASMNHIYSSRAIETACRRDINFMYLLEGKPAPDHARIARFISLHLSQCAKNILANMSTLLYQLGEISGETLFIDGTKMESCANRYTFVWKKGVSKNLAKLLQKAIDLVASCEEKYGLKLVYNNQISLHTLKRLRKKLYRLKEEEQIIFVHGIGKRKTALQKSIETLEEYIERLKKYTKQRYICGERNSYSKTDPNATFMRMKEDAMLNGQLKPAYKLQHGVDAEYIVWVGISAHPTDVHTLIPFLEDMEKHIPFKYQRIVADAGYESEENYAYLAEKGQEAYIKPQNYEQGKTRKYQKDIGRRENMTYDQSNDRYQCHNGKWLTAVTERKSKSKSGYVSVITVYECADCQGCPYKEECIKSKSKTPIEERVKRINVSKRMKELREQARERICSEYGKQLRMNRSIQVEGSFAELKEAMGLRRYSYRGRANVLAQSILLAIGHNINKQHNKIQSKRTKQHLYELKKST